MSKTFTITREVSYDDLWSAIWGSEVSGGWFDRVRTIDGKGISLWTQPDFEPNPQDFKVYDFEEEKWHEVTLEALAEGYRKALANKATHCGHYTFDDLDDPDACWVDIILQYAIFGELVYG